MAPVLLRDQPGALDHRSAFADPNALAQSIALPRRIWIVGHTGSGKSTLARELARRLGIEPTHLDDIFWQPRWQSLPEHEFMERVREIIARPSWVIDGNYRSVRRQYWDQADLVIWLDLPLRVTFPRVCWRTFCRWLTRARVCNGNRETFANTFLRKDSILWWCLSMHRSHRRRYALETEGRNCLQLRSPRSVRQWLRERSTRG